MNGLTPEANLQAQEKLDISFVVNPEAKAFAVAWSTQRNFNTQFYRSVSEDQFDRKLVDGSPSTRENLQYQIRVHDNYLKGIREGALKHGQHYAELELDGLSKEQLLEMLDGVDRQIVDFVASEDRLKMVTVPWSETPVTALAAFWGLKDHEVYHLGRNSLMGEVLGIPRPDELRARWG